MRNHKLQQYEATDFSEENAQQNNQKLHQQDYITCKQEYSINGGYNFLNK